MDKEVQLYNPISLHLKIGKYQLVGFNRTLFTPLYIIRIFLCGQSP